MGFTHLISVSLSDRGKKRQYNEDAVLTLPENGLFCVADGMGGLDAGATASKCIVNFLRETSGNSPDFNVVDFEQIVLISLKKANEYLLEFAKQHHIAGTGSTVAVLAFDPASDKRAVVFHAGDSRIYCIRTGTIERLTIDHSMATALKIKDTEVLPPFFRGLITRAVGLETDLEVERTVIDVAPDDLYILCSDGLTRMLSDEKILTIVSQAENQGLEAAAKQLVDAANNAGGDDNITLALVKVGKNSADAFLG